MSTTQHLVNLLLYVNKDLLYGVAECSLLLYVNKNTWSMSTPCCCTSAVCQPVLLPPKICCMSTLLHFNSTRKLSNVVCQHSVNIAQGFAVWSNVLHNHAIIAHVLHVFC
uniref:Uncharacterized protein n=1 Tax=Arundo donax TaxID=35708 RepID=A0A0A8ZUF0_ARUDO